MEIRKSPLDALKVTTSRKSLGISATGANILHIQLLDQGVLQDDLSRDRAMALLSYSV